MTNGEVLNSWKEIATYLGRGVRTVQRWERDLDLPVRRPRGKQRSAVIAIKEDLDLWLRTPHGVEIRGREVHHKNRTRLMENTHLLHSQTLVLIARSDVLRKQITHAINIGAALRQACSTGRAQRKISSDANKTVPHEVGRAVTLGDARSSLGGGEQPAESLEIGK